MARFIIGLLMVYCALYLGLAAVSTYLAGEGENGTICRAQVVEWARDGGRCTFVPVSTVLTGRLDNGVCITSEVGGLTE